MTTVAFIGAGNIAKAILGGYQSANPEAIIWATDPLQEQLDTLPPSVETTQDNHHAVAQAEVVVLCVKPNMMKPIAQDLAPIAAGKLFVSVAAGITCRDLNNWLGGQAATIRCMPNTPALIGEGMTGLYASPEVSEQHKKIAHDLLGSVGQVAWFEDEAQLDTVTAISGSGPAYFFYVLEAMQKAAVEMGLSPEVARLLSEQTAIGAAKMAQKSDISVGTLRQNVTSPGGTTAAALSVFDESDLTATIARALMAAEERSKALSSE